MSAVGDWIDLESRVSGKWQIPVLAVSLVLLSAATMRHRQSSRQATFGDALGQFRALQEGGHHERVIQLGTRLLDRAGGTGGERSEILLTVARARAAVDSADSARGTLVLRAYEAAREAGAELDASDFERIGEAHEAAGHLPEAIDHYEKALSRSAHGGHPLRRHLFDLLCSIPESSDRREQILEQILGDPGTTPEDRLWALTQTLHGLHASGRVEEAEKLIDQSVGMVEGGATSHSYQYLAALHLYLSGRLDEAEVSLRVLRSELDPWEPEYAKSGWLLGRVLLTKGGRENLESASSFFNDVLLHNPFGLYPAASRIGIGEVMAELGKYGESVDAFAEGINRLPEKVDPEVVPRDELYVRLNVLAGSLRLKGDYRSALEYARLALLLVDGARTDRVVPSLRQVAELQLQLADQLRIRGRQAGEGVEPPSYNEIRSLYSGAARTFLRLAELDRGAEGSPNQDRWSAAEMAREASDLRERAELEQSGLLLQMVANSQAEFAEELERRESRGVEGEPLQGEFRSLFTEAATNLVQLSDVLIWNEERSAASLWRAAELFARAGKTEEAIELFRLYMRSRPSDPMVPKASFNVGRLYEEAGRFSAAIEAYRECYERFPRSLEGARVLLPLARCHLRMGAAGETEAERTLRRIVDESEVFTPLAPEYSEALFMLGELLHRRGAFEDAVVVLGEALERTASHPARWDARFLLADSLRQSGIGLKRELTAARLSPAQEWMRSEFPERLRRARELYREYVQEMEVRDAGVLSRREAVGLRLAMLYEADCYFEAGEYGAALQRYESIVRTLKGTPSALAAGVQIINCHVFLGEVSSARAALERMQAMIEGMPPEAFEGEPSLRTRDEWRIYLAWLDESGVL